jgi:hypothetical protein
VIGLRAKERTMGAGLLLLMAAHLATHPERGPWLLLSTCDIATLATAIGLVVGWHQAVGVAFLFQIAMGLPAFFGGLLTAVYAPNATSVAIHLLPPVAGGWAVARRGLPRHATALAFTVCGLAIVASLFSPPALNVNLVFEIWPPVHRLFPSRLAGLLVYHGVGPLILLSSTEVALRKWFPGAVSSPPAPSPAPPRDSPE